MSGISINEKFKGRVLQQLRQRKTYGDKTYKNIARSTGIKYRTVKYLATVLINEGKINLKEFTPDDEIQEEESNAEQIKSTSSANPYDINKESLAANREYIEKMLSRHAYINNSVISAYIRYCRDNLNTMNLKPEDYYLLGQVITSNIDWVTAENIKLGILGFVRISRIQSAKQFFKRCRIMTEASQKEDKCTPEELDQIGEELKDYEARLKIYEKLRKGYSIEYVIPDAVRAGITLEDLIRMEKAIKKTKQSTKEPTKKSQKGEEER